MAQTVYMYGPHNGEYLGTYKCQKNPMSDGDFLIPANATLIKPMAADENQVPAWSGTGWALVADYRGRLCINTDTGEVFEIHALGNIPDGFYLMSDTDLDSWNSGMISSVVDGVLIWENPPPIDLSEDWGSVAN